MHGAGAHERRELKRDIDVKEGPGSQKGNVQERAEELWSDMEAEQLNGGVTGRGRVCVRTVSEVKPKFRA